MDSEFDSFEMLKIDVKLPKGMFLFKGQEVKSPSKLAALIDSHKEPDTPETVTDGTEISGLLDSFDE